VLAKLASRVTKILEQATCGWIQLAHTHRRTGKADLGESGANAMLTSEKRGAPGRTRLLTVVMEELDTLATDAVNIRSFVTHQALGIGAQVRNADVVAPDYEDVGLASRPCRCGTLLLSLGDFYRCC